MFVLTYLYLSSLFVTNALFCAASATISLAAFHNRLIIIGWVFGVVSGALVLNTLNIFSNIIHLGD